MAIMRQSFGDVLLMIRLKSMYRIRRDTSAKMTSLSADDFSSSFHSDMVVPIFWKAKAPSMGTDAHRLSVA